MSGPTCIFPRINFYWARDYFPNFVEEDRRVMVSYDGHLYFSALDKIDQGNYSCNVHGMASDDGRNGPFFHLDVTPTQTTSSSGSPRTSPRLSQRLPWPVKT